MNWQLLAFLVLAVATLYAAWKVATTPNVTHAALYLAGVFVGVSGVYLLLQANFLAAVQIIIYAGAILTVTIFAIMLSDMPAISGRLRPNLFARLTSRAWGLLPLLVGALFAALILWAYAGGWAGLAGAQATAAAPGVAALGRELFAVYMVPFEVASVLLLAAMIGAIALTGRKEDRP
ncbi:MAG: NADH-quinone oxidoreductase subunit J [Clostridia bacterium]|nr:NADH-quinone oxidoreductase subunit J [Clostridia bacterium]MCL6522129.1 NADH-quinone oxidoreductase subunit J [Bacillota bacterium]